MSSQHGSTSNSDPSNAYSSEPSIFMSTSCGVRGKTNLAWGHCKEALELSVGSSSILLSLPHSRFLSAHSTQSVTDTSFGVRKKTKIFRSESNKPLPKYPSFLQGRSGCVCFTCLVKVLFLQVNKLK
uniref:Uncharacterized protein n=1 Tax=Populus alba TaxID=43335 RepID=A0A4U5Q920_POPAL|nr:hypothetical protein D5086_0000120350 [Populus alba]